MSFLAGIVVLNFKNNDYDKYLEGFETIICKVLIQYFKDFRRMEVNDDRFIFSFPHDPSIISEDVPVWVQIHLFTFDNNRDGRGYIVDKIREQLSELLGRKVIVSLSFADVVDY